MLATSKRVNSDWAEQITETDKVKTSVQGGAAFQVKRRSLGAEIAV